MRRTRSGKGATAAVAACLALAATAAADDLVVIDLDAHVVSGTQAGAVFSFDPAAPSNSAPAILAAADQGAPFAYLAGLAVSPVDGAACVSDWGVATPPATPPVIHRVDCVTNALTIVAADPRFTLPLGLAFLPDGRLVVADWDADPSALGADSFGGPGHGAIFLVDTSSCATGCAVSLLSDGRNHPFGPAIRTAFEDPVAVQYDGARGRLLVGDLAAPPAIGLTSTVLGVDLVTGAVTLVSSNPAWNGIIALGIEPDGTILAVDNTFTPGGGTVWSIDPMLPPASNATPLSRGAQYSFIEDVDVDSAGRIFVIDSGEWDSGSGTFIVPPALFEIDTTIANPAANGVLINDSVELLTPIGIAARQACTAAPGQLAINRRARRDSQSVRLQFVDPTCVRPPWSFCVGQLVGGALDGLTLPGEGAASSPNTVWFYEHSDPSQAMKLRRVGADLVLSAF